MPKITLTNVTKQWGNFIGVNDLNLEIEDGAFVTLLGSSGCGKSTARTFRQRQDHDPSDDRRARNAHPGRDPL